MDFQSRNLYDDSGIADEDEAPAPVSVGRRHWQRHEDRRRARINDENAYGVSTRHAANVSGSNPYGFNRPDLIMRRAVHRLICDIMLSHVYDPEAAAALLEDCAADCERSSVPFGELLAEDIEGAGAPPLAFELGRCDWPAAQDAPPPLLALLLEHVGRRSTPHVRRACAGRNDDALFQRVRPYLPAGDLPGATQSVDASVATTPRGFTVTLTTAGFPAMLRDAERHYVGEQRAEKSETSMPGDSRAGIWTEWIAYGRAWALRISSNDLSLRLLHGKPAHITDARALRLTCEESILLSVGTLEAGGWLRAAAQFDDPDWLLDGHELVLELLVEGTGVDEDPFASPSETPNPFVDPPETAPAKEGEESDWEEVDAFEGTEDVGWVKASWSGADEEV